MARVAITGASGLVGRHLVGRIESESEEVRVLVRHGRVGGGPRVRYVHGDLLDSTTLSACFTGVETVVHLASTFSEPLLTRVILHGTEAVVAAAREAGVKRLVFLSCMGAGAASQSAYFRAKWRAERAVLESGLTPVLLRPSLILGPEDGILTPLAWLVRRLPAVPVVGQGLERTQPVRVEDVARAIGVVLTENMGDTTIDFGGPAYVTFRELIDLVGVVLGVSRRKVLLPASAIRVLAPLLPDLVRPLYEGARLHQFQTGVVASPGAVSTAFGFHPAPISDAIGRYLQA